MTDEFDPHAPGPPREVQEDAAARERSMTASGWNDSPSDRVYVPVQLHPGGTPTYVEYIHYARVAALEADKARLVAALEDAKGTLGMLRSIIDSGERWTGESAGRYFDTITTIGAELDAVKGGGDDG